MICWDSLFYTVIVLMLLNNLMITICLRFVSKKVFVLFGIMALFDVLLLLQVPLWRGMIESVCG